jgi:hypothetical protein
MAKRLTRKTVAHPDLLPARGEKETAYAWVGSETNVSVVTLPISRPRRRR